MREQRLHQTHVVPVADLGPALPAQHRRGIEQDDPVHLGFGARIEPGARAEPHHRDRVGILRLRGRRGDPHRHLRLDRLEDSGEQLGLVGEVVIQRAAGQPGRPNDLFGADIGEAARGEQRPRGGHQGVARGGRPLGLGTRFVFHTGCMYV